MKKSLPTKRFMGGGGASASEERSIADKEAIRKAWKTARPYVEPLAQAAGTVGGAVLGVPAAGPAGSLLGGGLGYAAANRLLALADSLAGDQPLPPPGEQFTSMGKDVLEGAAASLGGSALANPAAAAVKRKLVGSAGKEATKESAKAAARERAVEESRNYAIDTAAEKARLNPFLAAAHAHKRGGKISSPAAKGYAKGGSVSASKRADGIAQRGKTRGKMR